MAHEPRPSLRVVRARPEVPSRQATQQEAYWAELRALRAQRDRLRAS